MRKLNSIIHFILNHPLGRRHKLTSIFRFLSWQLGQLFFPGARIISFIGGAKMNVRKNDTGVTGNIYVGIQDFYEISFALHFLKENDVFADIGANVGFYSIIISNTKKIKSFSFEPVPSTFKKLQQNIELNKLQGLVIAKNIAIGSSFGNVKMSANLDTVNHVKLSNQNNEEDVIVEVHPLDSILLDYGIPSLIKIDVEGFETEVIRGMKNILASTTLKAIIIELNGSGGRYGFDEGFIHQTLLDNSFKPYEYNPFTREVKEIESFGNTNTIYLRDLGFILSRIKSAPSFSVFGESI
jgi:hypothetical protein